MLNHAVTFYMCKTDYLYEMDATYCTTYPSLETLKKSRKCVYGCGAVENAMADGRYTVTEVLAENRGRFTDGSSEADESGI